MNKTFEIEGPEWAASYLINGDHSGISTEEKNAVDKWLEREGVRILSLKEDSAMFTWSYRFFFPEGDEDGGTVITYIAEYTA